MGDYIKIEVFLFKGGEFLRCSLTTIPSKNEQLFVKDENFFCVCSKNCQKKHDWKKYENEYVFYQNHTRWKENFRFQTRTQDPISQIYSRIWFGMCLMIGTITEKESFNYTTKNNI